MCLRRAQLFVVPSMKEYPTGAAVASLDSVAPPQKWHKEREHIHYCVLIYTLVLFLFSWKDVHLERMSIGRQAE